jgi:hypothetical protein
MKPSKGLYDFLEKSIESFTKILMVGISSLRFATCNTGVCAVQVSLDFWYLNPNKMKTRQNSKNHWL